MGAFKDLTGKKFGKLTAKSYYRKNGRTYWCCVCECGNIVEVRSDGLSTGQTKSCGCLHKEILSKLNTKHKKCHTRLYDSWTDLKQRCYNKHNKRYKDYGERGIKVCDEWLNDFMNFYNWAVNNGYTDSLTIDRINNNGDYEPSNCRWATPKEQIRNRNNTKYITYKGITKPFAEWCEIYNLSYTKVYNRINYYHWSIERAFELEEK